MIVSAWVTEPTYQDHHIAGLQVPLIFWQRILIILAKLYSKF